MSKVNRPKIINDFNSYLNGVITKSSAFDFIEFEKYFNDYLEFLRTLYKQNFNKVKEYGNDHIAEQIFLNKIYNVKEYYKYSIYAIIKTCSRISENIKWFSDKSESKNILQEIRLFSEILGSTIDFVNSSNLLYNNQKINFGYFKTNCVNSTQVYNASQNLFHENLNLKSDSIVAIRNTSIFLIRQSIELRLKNAIGLNYVYHNNGETVKLRHDLLLDFIKCNTTNFTFPTKFSILEKIYKWTNLYIHNGIHNYLWLIDWAYIILNPLFKPFVDDLMKNILNGDYSVLPENQAYNRFGSIRIKKDFYENHLKNNLKEFISEETGISVSDFNISFSDSIEAMLVK